MQRLLRKINIEDISLSGEWIRPLCGKAISNVCTVSSMNGFRHPVANCKGNSTITNELNDEALYIEDFLNPDNIGLLSSIDIQNMIEQAILW